ncbi:Ribosomal L29 protein [Nakaseomyces glabratus]|nr:Ribosomal L29 protein [Nakaseomyces glabratus]KAH7585443.1 Ribosomal L29 protein [Nakaseomyces glabratus]KAH7598522.1 Ribosomal L29 protein [Nakaseomyces glabratus]KAH7604811.1 Ribosomal L29 protein [Nakaseomyces glabratus]
MGTYANRRVGLQTGNFHGAGVKAYELRTKSKEQLENQLLSLKKELAELQVQKLSRPSLPKIHTVRKDIARVLTIINEQQREAVRQLYKGKKYQPKDMRAKKTRALRRALTKFEATRVTEKQKKKQIAFPQRKYAIKA